MADMQASPSVTKTFRLPPGLAERLRAEATRQFQSENQTVQDLLSEALAARDRERGTRETPR